MLKRLRDEAGRSQSATARAIGKDQTRLSRVELGRGSLSPDELARLLDFLEVGRDERETALSLGAQSRKRQRAHAYTDVLPDSFQRLADLEADAAQIRSYEVGIIPGILQSPEYVEAALRIGDGVWWDASSSELTRRVEFRIQRQHRVLEAAQPPRKLDFVFVEDALRHVVGDTSVMRSQILHLLQLGEKHPNLAIQVIPSGTANNPILGGGLMVLDFNDAPRIGFASAVYGPSTYHDQPRDTARMLNAFNQARKLALTPAESRDLLVDQMKASGT